MSPAFLIAVLVDRLTAHLDGVCRFVAACIDTAGPDRALMQWVSTRLDRGSARVRVLLARLAAGEALATRARGSRAAGSRRGRSANGVGRTDGVVVPRKRGWLTALIPAAGAHGAALRELMAHPEMGALLAAVPSSGRLMRSLWRMLNTGKAPPILRADRLAAIAGVSGEATWSDLQAAFDDAAERTNELAAQMDATASDVPGLRAELAAEPGSALTFEDACAAALRSFERMKALAFAIARHPAGPPRTA